MHLQGSAMCCNFLNIMGMIKFVGFKNIVINSLESGCNPSIVWFMLYIDSLKYMRDSLCF